MGDVAEAAGRGRTRGPTVSPSRNQDRCPFDLSNVPCHLQPTTTGELMRFLACLAIVASCAGCAGDPPTAREQKQAEVYAAAEACLSASQAMGDVYRAANDAEFPAYEEGREPSPETARAAETARRAAEERSNAACAEADRLEAELRRMPESQ